MDTGNPWKTLGTRQIYENAWLSLREDKVIRPDGEPGIYSVVETRNATGVVALTAEDEVYLVGQYRYPLDIYSWEIPEGGSEPGEAPLDTIKRELEEEAGVTANTWHQLGGVVHLSNCYSNEKTYMFLAEDLVASEANPDGTEILQIRKVSFAEAIDMVNSGVITDAISIIALLRAERFLRDRAAAG